MNSQLDLIRSLYEYNSAVRKKYLKTIFRRVPTKERYKDRSASFPSLADIFVHILDAYRWWFIFVCEDRPSEYRPLRVHKKYTIKEVEEDEKKIDDLVMNFVRGLKEQDLDRTISYKDGSKVKRVVLRDMLLHMVEEELQHRGELNALLWQMDISPPITEYHHWIRSQSTQR